MLMAAEKKSVANLVNLCHLLTKEVGMPNMALQELLNRSSAASELESFQSVMFWKYATANFYLLEEKIAMGPFNPHMKKQVVMKPQIPDLNQPAPESEEPWELDFKPSVIMQLMAAENKSVASLLNLCHRLMEELGMPKMVLNELIGRVCGTSELESFQSVKYWKSVTAHFYFLEEKIAMGSFRPDKNQGIIMKPQIPDLNQPAPGNEEKPAVGPFKPNMIQSTIMQPQIPDLNQPAPGNDEEEPWELH